MSKAGLNKKDFMFQNKKGETLTKVPGQINGRDFLISNLEDCEVFLMDYTAQIFVDDCKNCTIHIGPVEASLFIRDCENLKVSAACSQYRVSDSTNIDSYIYSQTDPTLEKCRGLRFAPYNFAYPLQNEHFEKAKLDPKINHWSQVFDFNENKQDPNWTILPPEEYPGPVSKTVDDMEEPSNPVEINKEYGGTLDGPIIVGSREAGGTEDQGMMAFGINTGADQAQNVFEAAQKEVETHEVHEDVHEEAFGQPHDQENQPHEEPETHVQENTDVQHEAEYFPSHQEETQYQQQEEAQYQHQEENQNQQQEYLPQENQQIQAGATDYDDMFGTPSTQTQSQTQPQVTETQSYQIETTQQSYTMPQASGYGQGGYGYGGDYDPEEEERLERLRRLEQERFRKLEDKARIEREKKQERIVNAAHELAKWHSEREQNIEKRKQMNRNNQQLQDQANNENQFKNPWEKIVANIALKEGEYPGTKDVTRFRQALVNKKLDAAKGIGADLPNF